MERQDVNLLKETLLEIRSNLLGDIKKTRKSSQDKEFTEFVSDITDDAARSFTRQMILNLGEHEREKLKLVEEALYKLQRGGYGICSLCEETIPPARLKIVPFAQYCVECLSKMEHEKKLEDSPNNNTIL